MTLNAREKNALSNIVSESAFLQGDFQVPGKLSSNVGPKTFDSLMNMGFIERGKSKRHHGAIGYRPTEAGIEFERNHL